MLKTKP